MMTPLRKIRLQNGLTLEQLASDTGLTVSALSRIERMERHPKPSTAKRLLAYFGGALQADHILQPDAYPNFLEKVSNIA